MSGRKKLEINLEDVRERRSRKESFADIGRVYGCSGEYVWQKLKIENCWKRAESRQESKDKTVVSLNRSKILSTAKVKIVDQDLYYYMADMLHGELRKMYFIFLRNNHQDSMTFDKLIKMSGPKRAKILRSNRNLRKMYTEKTQRI